MNLAIALCCLGAASIQDARWVRIVDAETGAALAGVTVMEDPMSDGVISSQPRPAVHLGVTDGDGLVAYRSVRGIARVEVPGYTPALYPAQFGRPAQGAARVIEVLRSAHLTIGVVDADGKPAQAVRVKLEGRGYDLMQRNLLGSVFPDGVQLERTTDSEGKVEFENVPAECPLEVTLIEVLPSRAWEYTRPTRDLVLGAGEQRTERYWVGASHDVFGRVVGPDGEAIADAPLALRPARLGWPKLQRGRTRGWLRAKTDAAGEFSFADVPAGDWWVGVEPKWGTGPAQAFTIRPDHAPRGLSIQHWSGVRGHAARELPANGGQERFRSGRRARRRWRR